MSVEANHLLKADHLHLYGSKMVHIATARNKLTNIYFNLLNGAIGVGINPMNYDCLAVVVPQNG